VCDWGQDVINCIRSALNRHTI